jgi:hypothetical protein
MSTHAHLIAGRRAAGEAATPVINPPDGAEVGRLARGTAREVDAATSGGGGSRRCGASARRDVGDPAQARAVTPAG